ncbi:MAG TPA: hypothetical protein VIH17_00455 [Candidatus Acidoferrales bacterium]
MRLDDRLRQLLRELGKAINESVSDSDQVADVIGTIRASGYDIFLVLDATIGLSKRPEDASLVITSQDKRFLKRLHIRLDDEGQATVDADAEPRQRRGDGITSQDMKFLRSLKISLDEDAK